PNVLDQGGAGGGAVARPQLLSMHSVVGRKVQRSAHGRQAVRVGVGAARVDVLDQDRAGGGAVALPQLLAVGPVVGREEQRAAHGRQATGRRGGRKAVGAAGVDVLDEDGPNGGAITLP